MLALLIGGCAKSKPRDPDDRYMEVVDQKSAQALLDEQHALEITPEKVKGNPDFQVLNGAAVPYVPEYHIGPGDVMEVVYHIHYEKSPEDYRLEVQDRISVHLPYNPQFSTTALVRSDGKVSLPLVGELSAAGKTVSEFTGDLDKSYSRFIKNPSVSVALEEFNVKIDELKKAITTASRGQSKIAPVLPDGRVSFPIVGNIAVIGLTVNQLETEINKRYAEFVRNLQVTVILLEVHANRLYIFGEVNVPGIYEMSDRYNLLQALAQAGGFKPSANLSEVLVFRNTGLERPLVYKIDVQNMLDKGFLYSGVFLSPGDVVYVPKSRLDNINDMIAKVFTRGIWAVVPFQTGAAIGLTYTNYLSTPASSVVSGAATTTATTPAVAPTVTTTTTPIRTSP
ncbi:MAG: polysaccharide biosynthesis/export family protein [Desulfovibrionaceae bacterium]|nr:polysaccharide biosynthesis/export family protein [Desulfovibrionaceae bacterium]